MSPTSARRWSNSTLAEGAALVDANLLIWAHHQQFTQHPAAHEWWGRLLSEVPMVGLPWPSILAFVRVSTHHRALERPLNVRQAWAVVDTWLDRPNTWIPVPTERHRGLLAGLIVDGEARGNHVPDAHLAALALEWGLELLSADRDFARYPGLRWRDPLSESPL